MSKMRPSQSRLLSRRPVPTVVAVRPPRRPVRTHPITAPRRPKRPWIEFDSDGLFAFAAFTSVLFIGGLGTIGAVIVMAIMVAYGLFRFKQLREILVPRAFILAIPAFAMFSYLWSQAPAATAKYSIEFALTVGLGLLLSAAPRPKAVLWGIFPAFAIYVMVSLVFGGAVAMGDDGATAFSGLTQSKNLLGDVAATGLLISLACFVAGIEDRRPFRFLAALAVAAMHGYVLIHARSAGALLGIAVALCCFIFFLALRPARFLTRVVTTSFVALCTLFAVVAYGTTFIEDAMTMFEKDPTLTGRTYLWQRGADLIAYNPLLGKGFGAFWIHGNLDAEGLWEWAGIGSRTGFTFHNTAIEILVHLGWIGLFVFGTTAIAATLVVLCRVIRRPTLTLCFWLSVIAYAAARISIESIGVTPFAHSTILLYAAFGSPFAVRRLVPATNRAARSLNRLSPFQPSFVSVRDAEPYPAGLSAGGPPGVRWRRVGGWRLRPSGPLVSR